MTAPKPFLVRFRPPGSWAVHEDYDRREYTSLPGALRGIAQGLNPRPPGRGRTGADLYEVDEAGNEDWLGHAAWGDGVYWLDLSEDGLKAGLKYDPEETTP